MITWLELFGLRLLDLVGNHGDDGDKRRGKRLSKHTVGKVP